MRDAKALRLKDGILELNRRRAPDMMTDPITTLPRTGLGICRAFQADQPEPKKFRIEVSLYYSTVNGDGLSGWVKNGQADVLWNGRIIAAFPPALPRFPISERKRIRQHKGGYFEFGKLRKQGFSRTVVFIDPGKLLPEVTFAATFELGPAAILAKILFYIGLIAPIIADNGQFQQHRATDGKKGQQGKRRAHGPKVNQYRASAF